MFNKFSNRGLAASLLSASLLLTACGGSSGGSGGGDEPSNTSVAGPLDVVQEPLSTQVFGGLSSAAAGTPLEGAISCVGDLVANDVLDVLDSLLVKLDPATLQDPQALFTESAADLQATVTQLAERLPLVLASLTGASCDGSDSTAGGNPLDTLAGTPLAPLADALAPVLGGMDSSGGGMDSASLSALVEMISDAFSDGLATIVAQDPTGQVAEAPVLGGLLTTLDVALQDLSTTVAALETTDPDAVASALAVTVNHLLNGVLLDVIPVKFIEEQSGQGSVFSDPISDAIFTLTSSFGSGFSGFGEAGFTDAFGGSSTDLFATFQNSALGPLLAPITSALGGQSSGGAGTTGTPLDVILDPLLALGDSLSAEGSEGSAFTGTPLDLLIAPILAAAENEPGTCPLNGTPLSAVCGLLDTLLGGLLGFLQP
ncbi:MAG: hypothetical protein ACSHWQ_07635 [Spongiibacteraceae bacterium]